jgi:TolB-like protein
LSKVSGLIVIARSSSFVYKGVPTDVRRIVNDLAHVSLLRL